MGSIRFTAEVGKTYAKGDEMGYFAFGGSTTIALFHKDAVVYDPDIVSNRWCTPCAAVTCCAGLWATSVAVVVKKPRHLDRYAQDPHRRLNQSTLAVVAALLP